MSLFEEVVQKVEALPEDIAAVFRHILARLESLEGTSPVKEEETPVDTPVGE